MKPAHAPQLCKKLRGHAYSQINYTPSPLDDPGLG